MDACFVCFAQTEYSQGSPPLPLAVGVRFREEVSNVHLSG